MASGHGRLTRLAASGMLATALALVMSLGALAPRPAWAEAPASSPADTRERELSTAQREADAAKVLGPADVPLLDQATLALPRGYLWVPQPAAGHLMHALGNRSNDGLLGLVMPVDDMHWMVVAQFDKAGYVKDDDAKNWNVDELFNNLKEGTEAANEDRRQRGFGEIEIVGWVEPPHYDTSGHRLVWSMAARTKGEAAGGDNGINYNTYALGRDGYISLNLLTDQAHVAQDKTQAATLLQALHYQDGKRYEDFNGSTDKVAAYGLAALVGGVALKKLGMFAVAAGLFTKFAKVILLGAIGLVSLLGKIFKRKV